jgi:hypothetical protein
MDAKVFKVRFKIRIGAMASKLFEVSVPFRAVGMEAKCSK